jgi:hypothetical protein
MNSLDKTQLHSAFAFVSVMLLAAAIFSAPLIRAESTASGETQSFIGTTPDAAGPEVQPPTF